MHHAIDDADGNVLRTGLSSSYARAHEVALKLARERNEIVYLYAVAGAEPVPGRTDSPSVSEYVPVPPAHTADTLTTAQVNRLRDEAIDADDTETADLCRVALAGKGGAYKTLGKLAAHLNAVAALATRKVA